MGLDLALELLERIVLSEARYRLSDIASELNIPMSTAYRLVASLEKRGLVIGIGAGRYAGGFALAKWAMFVRPTDTLSAIARPHLRRLARTTKATAHLGIFEADMVTYLIKEGSTRTAIFTREAMQLEAYCSGVGKVLIAALPATDREEYLSSGGFVPLTARTITDPGKLRRHLAQVLAQGYALDMHEAADNLCCLAVPLRDATAGTFAAISIACYGAAPNELLEHLPLLRETSNALTARLGKDAGYLIEKARLSSDERRRQATRTAAARATDLETELPREVRVP
ncbi:Putative transcriptional regulator (modular protein) [Mesorhizobium sp. SOD10]|nr:Putative transcriptional regulator (modular protein) [Mesorhizobium sp. SOD10]